MKKIIDEGIAKGLSGKELGLYVFTKLKGELDRDSVFFESFKYYLAKHLDKLRTSEQAGVAFGEILIQVMRINRRLAATVVRAAVAIPIFGPIAEVMAGVGEGVGELGEGIGESIRSSKKNREIKVRLGQHDDLIEFF